LVDGPAVDNYVLLDGMAIPLYGRFQAERCPLDEVEPAVKTSST
jgi:hypothetical protein